MEWQTHKHNCVTKFQAALRLGCVPLFVPCGMDTVYVCLSNLASSRGGRTRSRDILAVHLNSKVDLVGACSVPS